MNPPPQRPSTPQPFLSGFTLARNALRYEYPLHEVLTTLLALCDEVVLALSPSGDGTEELARSLKAQHPKLRIIEFFWDEQKREGGRVLAEATFAALHFCTGKWCLYLQADELLHEKDFPRLLRALALVDPLPEVEALVFPYLHFYGSYEYIGRGRQWYRYEARLFRNTGFVEPYRDAQGFRVREGKRLRKLRGVLAPIPVYHYGWVRSPSAQLEKLRAFYALYHPPEEIEARLGGKEEFDYRSAFEVERFTGSHPACIKERIEKARAWTSRFDPRHLPRKPFWIRILDAFEARTGIRVGEFRNYRFVHPPLVLPEEKEGTL